MPERAWRAGFSGPAVLPSVRCADDQGGQVNRNVKAENEYLRKALALRRKLQEFLDDNVCLDDRNALTETFTLGDGPRRRVTGRQLDILMAMAPDDVRKANE